MFYRIKKSDTRALSFISLYSFERRTEEKNRQKHLLNGFTVTLFRVWQTAPGEQ